MDINTILTLAGVIVSVTTSAVLLAWKMSRWETRSDRKTTEIQHRVEALETRTDHRMDTLETRVGHRMDGLETQMAYVGHYLSTVSTLIAALLSRLAESEVLGVDDLSSFIPKIVRLAPIDQILGGVQAGNPVTKEEHARLRQYVEWARTGKPFTPAQAEDFDQLARRIEKEQPSEGAIWLLVLAAFILGYYWDKDKGGERS